MVLGIRAHRTVVQAERMQTSNGITLIDNLYCTFENLIFTTDVKTND